MGKARLEKIKNTQPQNLGCLNPIRNIIIHQHKTGKIKNRNNRNEILRRK